MSRQRNASRIAGPVITRTVAKAEAAVQSTPTSIVEEVMPETVEMDIAAMMAEIKRLSAENANLSARASRNNLKVSDKGGVSVYGLGRFPVTLYPEQWRKLIAMVPAIDTFIEANKAALTWKAEAEQAAA